MAAKTLKKFQELLLSYSQAEETDIRRNIEEALWREYGAEYAIEYRKG
jgi:hypothetical protein